MSQPSRRRRTSSPSSNLSVSTICLAVYGSRGIDESRANRTKLLRVLSILLLQAYFFLVGSTASFFSGLPCGRRGYVFRFTVVFELFACDVFVDWPPFSEFYVTVFSWGNMISKVVNSGPSMRPLFAWNVEEMGTVLWSGAYKRPKYSRK